MDNDNKLVQKAADLYRSLRFAMKYRGVEILSAEDGNDLARGLLESGRPFLFARCGATEMRRSANCGKISVPGNSPRYRAGNAIQNSGCGGRFHIF